MNNYLVYMEIMGSYHIVGSISGNSFSDAAFQYSVEYMNSENSKPISVSLTLTEFLEENV